MIKKNIKSKTNKKSSLKLNLKRILFCDKIFIVFIVLTLLGGFIKCFMHPIDINVYENRTANKVSNVSIKNFFNGKYQDNMELAFADQIPKSSTMKKAYNFANNMFIYYASKAVFKNTCNNSYIPVNDKISKFGCGDNLVFSYYSFDTRKSYMDERIKDINSFTKKNDVDLYLYYIEKDTDINFETNKKIGLYNYIKNNINIKKDHIDKFSIDSFEEFNKYFYKTDHHWNNKGSYLAYTQLVKMMTNDEPIENINEQCLNNKISGSKATMGAVTRLYKEDFCFYNFDIPKHKTYIDGKESEYGLVGEKVDSNSQYLSYAAYYGNDNGIVKISYNNKKKNLLVIGESYDNALLKLLSTHYNNTYDVDLRNYEREMGKKFNIDNFIEKNSIDVVLLIGNNDYYVAKEFNLEG